MNNKVLPPADLESVCPAIPSFLDDASRSGTENNRIIPNISDFHFSSSLLDSSNTVHNYALLSDETSAADPPPESKSASPSWSLSSTSSNLTPPPSADTPSASFPVLKDEIPADEISLS